MTMLKLRSTLLSAVIVAMLMISSAPSAHAVNKETIQLQTQVQQLLDLVQRLQSTIDQQFGALQHQVQQNTDALAGVTQTVNTLAQKLQAQSDASGAKVDAISGQVQGMNDSVDELKSRLAKVDKQLQDIQTTLQNLQSPSSAPATAAPTAASPSGEVAPPAESQVQGPPLKSTYESGLRDYNAAKYELATQEFGDVLHYYPTDDLAGNAQFYLGEVAFRQGRYKDAIKAYDAVLEQFSGNVKAPAAQLHKADSLIQLGQKEAGIREFRSLIQRHPQSPEGQQARSRLNSMGVRIKP
jgi:tol-pal system protein YbgF